MAKVIARIRLAKGETGYYDEKSGIFLSWGHPEADVMEGTDCSGLRTSRRCGRIKVLSGDLGKSKSLKEVLAEAKAKRLGVPVESVLHKDKKRPVYVETVEATAKTVVEDETVKNNAKAEDPVVEETKVEEPAAETKADESVAEMKAEEAAPEKAVEAPVEAPAEEKPKKTTRRRRTTKKADAKAE